MTVPSPLEDVRAQYEVLPYPPRDPRDEAIRLITGTPSHILEVNHYLFSGRLNFNRPFRALVAGGGTGDACIMLAQQLVDRRCPGEVVYLDLSTASRQICESRAKARGLRNIQFLTGSLLDLPSMPIGEFDYIDCTGVLHHLPDPAAGMRALASVLQSPCMDGNGLTVFIGSEHQDPDLQHFSVVTSTYTDGKRTGAVGIIGPTRMRYSRAINVVDSLSRTINRVFDNS